MNISMLKLKGRGYLIGNITVISLLFFSALCFSLCLNIIPGVIYQAEMKLAENLRNVLVFASSLFAVVFLFAVFSALFMGIDRFFLRKAQKTGASTADFFHYFRVKEMFGMVDFSFKLTLLKLMMLSICFLPCVICGMFISSMLTSSASLNVSAILLIAFVCLFLNGARFYFHFTGTLFLAKYYYIKGEYLNFRQLVASSQCAMKKHMKTLKKLKLSFTGWFLLCLFIFPAVYVFSYYRQSAAVAASEFMKTDPLQNL